jgi:RNA polymerase sigma-70 factor (ECF subfamily)
LASIHPTPIVQINRAVAIAMTGALDDGIALIDTIELPEYYLLHAARADLLRRAKRSSEAADAYRKALALVTNDAERRFLERRLDAVIYDRSNNVI